MQSPDAMTAHPVTQREFLMSERSSRRILISIVAGRRTIAAGALLAVFAFPLAVATAQATASAQSAEVAALPNAPEVAESGASSSVAAAPANAAPEIQKAADFVSKRKGGRGAVRDVVEKILKAQGKWSVK